ncbi:MAG: methyltransferase domain-containing protein [Acidimicrobiia bacterium]|nr:methyltransferase domain-containing protein [Acidimicrobiia bacterium]
MADDVTARAREFFRRAADGWDRWGEAMQRDDAARYLEAAAVASGDRVLEIGAGGGEQTLTLAEQVGPQGTVVATDLSPEMLEVGARRVSEAGFDNVKFIAAGIDALDLEEASFDACVSGFTWEFLADPLTAAVIVRDLLAPGGRFVASVWDQGASVPMRSIVGTVVLSELGIPLPTPPAGLADPSRFARVLADAGFSPVSVTEFPVRMGWATPEAYAQSMRGLAPSLQDLIDAHDPKRTDEIWGAVARAAEEHVAEDGTVLLVNQAFMGVGVRPE